MNRPHFRPVAAPMNVDDAALEKLNETLKVPTLVNPVAGMPALGQELRQDAPNEEARPSPSPKTPAAKKSASASISKPARAEPAIRLSVMVPAYLSDAVNLRAAQERSTVRHVVMQALAAFGFEVNPADLVPDGRRPKRRSRT